MSELRKRQSVTVELDEASIAAARTAGIDLSELLVKHCSGNCRASMPRSGRQPQPNGWKRIARQSRRSIDSPNAAAGRSPSLLVSDFAGMGLVVQGYAHYACA
jgi:hypothetical protein